MSGDKNCKRVHTDGEGVSDQMNPKEPKSARQVIAGHPLNNALVLDIVLDNFPKEDLKSARLVNKSWESNSTLVRQWRDEMIYKLGDGRPGTINARFLKKQHPTNDPTDPMHLSRHPIRNISAGCDYSYIVLRSRQIPFWELFGPGLKVIRFDEVRIHHGTLLKKLLFELTPNLEEFRYYKCVCNDLGKLELNTTTRYTRPATLQNNLKFMDLTTSNMLPDEGIGNDYRPRFPISWIEFFSKFPNLKRLKVEIDPKDSGRPSDILKLINAIRIIRRANKNKVLNITNLETGQTAFTQSERALLDALSPGFLPIKILTMDVTYMDSVKIACILLNVVSTLRELTLVKPDHCFGDYLPNCFFPGSLVKLGLHGPIVPTFQFVLRIPKLKELELGDITDMVPRNVRPVPAADDPIVMVKKLTFTLKDTVSVEDMEAVTKWFPKVKHCVCTVGTNGFRAVCRGWPRLERLEVKFDFDNEVFFVVHVIQLEKLTSLKIDSSKISDESVFQGFLLMPALKRIQLPKNSNITEQGRAALARKMRVY